MLYFIEYVSGIFSTIDIAFPHIATHFVYSEFWEEATEDESRIRNNNNNLFFIF